MHYFTIQDQTGEHLGFLIMLADDEHESQPKNGRFVIKLQSEQYAQDHPAIKNLLPYQTVDGLFYWIVEKDYITLLDNQQPIGSIKQEYLKINGQTFILGDLTGTL